MASTGRIGTADSRPGNLQPGVASGGGPPPPPPPPPPPVSVAPASLVALASEANFRRFAFQPINPLAPKFLIRFGYPQAPGAAVEAAQLGQVPMPSFGNVARHIVPGPWNRSFVTRASVPPYPPLPVPDQPPAMRTAYPVVALNSPQFLGLKFVFGKLPTLGTSQTVAPVDPDVPPVPPDPSLGTVGGSRRDQVLVPRAPQQPDKQSRAHMDKVAGICNSLIRQGYIRGIDVNEYMIVSGAYKLSRPPAVTDDVTVGVQPGNLFIDTLTGGVYVNISNGENSAVWAGPLGAGGTGSPGPAGPQGPQGNTGAPGPPGNDGAPGAAGSPGPQGSPGANGLPGGDGSDGVPGPAGTTGSTGPAGGTGATGPQGSQGPTGLPGEDGADGLPGPAGANGANGAAGATGQQGASGLYLQDDSSSDAFPFIPAPQPVRPNDLSYSGYGTVQAYGSTTQALTQSAWNTIQLDTETVDADATFAPGTYTWTPNATGVYLVNFYTNCSGTTVRNLCGIWIGTASLALGIADGPNTGVGATVMFTATAATGYTFRVFPTGAGVSALGGATNTFLSIRRLY